MRLPHDGKSQNLQSSEKLKAVVLKDQMNDLKFWKVMINDSRWQSKKKPQTVYQHTDLLWVGIKLKNLMHQEMQESPNSK